MQQNAMIGKENANRSQTIFFLFYDLFEEKKNEYTEKCREFKPFTIETTAYNQLPYTMSHNELLRCKAYFGFRCLIIKQQSKF